MVQEASAEAVSPGPVARLFQAALPGVPFELAASPGDEVLCLRRDDFARVMQTARDDERLAFDYLRCLSGVDWLTEFEVVYHLYSYRHGYPVALKVRCPYEDPHVPTVSHLWQAANWHERETHEMFGIFFDGHPDLRPLLTEEGLGYYVLRKTHPLAEIEEWQEDYLRTIEDAKAQAAAGGEAPPVETAICNGARSTTAGMMKVDKAALSATLTGTRRARAAFDTDSFTAGSSVAAITTSAPTRSPG